MADPTASPGDLPFPSADLSANLFSLVPPSQLWVRIHLAKDDPLHFSRSERSRWDCGNPFGAMCVAKTVQGAILERFGDQMRAGGPILTKKKTIDFAVTRITLDPQLPVIDLRDDHLFKVGIDSRIFAGDYSVSRAYSAAFMRHPANAHGVLFNSRHDPSQTNLVLFDRYDPGTWIHAGRTIRLRDSTAFWRTAADLRIAIA
jgi:hypothetical protein